MSARAPWAARTLAGAAIGALLAAAGCERNQPPTVYFERMWHQRRGNLYAASPLFTDGKVMRPPPAGTVPQGDEILTPATEAAEALQLRPTRAMLERGRDRFDVYCAACHGPRADGNSPVAQFMTLRPPPSLLDERIRRLEPPQVFQVITEGYGLMPSYAPALSVADRWAVVSYVQVLQFRDHVPLEELPPDIRRRAMDQLAPAHAPGES